MGIIAIWNDGKRSKWTVVWLFLSFIAQLYVLSMRGEQRGGCPLSDTGEILIFLSWSLSMFYLLVGATYRVSLLGVFTAPFVTVMLIIAALPGVLESSPQKIQNVDYWGEMHAALSVLSYGALALGAVAAVMFLVLDSQLKSHHTSSGLFKNMATVHTLINSVVRLTLVGSCFLTVGIVCGLMMRAEAGAHLWVAVAVWLSYVLLLGVWYVRGLTPKRISLYVVLLFVASLTVFAAL